MKAKKTQTPTAQRDEHERENAPYLIEGFKLVRNYELLKIGHEVDNNLILDYIECNDADEAKRIRGWLWNAFAGGRTFQRIRTKGATDKVNAKNAYTFEGRTIKAAPQILTAFKGPIECNDAADAEYWAAQLRSAYNAGASAAASAAQEAR